MGRFYFPEDAKFGDSVMVYRDGYVYENGSDGTVCTHTLGPDVVVTYHATGLYAFKFDRKYHQLKSVTPEPVLVTTTDITHNLVQGGTDLTNTDRFEIQFKTGASAANLPAGTGFTVRVGLKDIDLPDGA